MLRQEIICHGSYMVFPMSRELNFGMMISAYVKGYFKKYPNGMCPSSCLV